jgi:hypothetical protein
MVLIILRTHSFFFFLFSIKSSLLKLWKPSIFSAPFHYEAGMFNEFQASPVSLPSPENSYSTAGLVFCTLVAHVQD